MRPERPIDLDLLLGAWAAPSPRAGFADRVLAACDAPARSRKEVAPSSRTAGLLLWAALAAAVIVAPLFFVHHVRQASPPPSVAAAADPDLGIERD